MVVLRSDPDGITGHQAEGAWRLLYDAMFDRVLSSFY